MNITGQVLANIRGVNINGYDCFANLAPDSYYYKTTASLSQYTVHGVTSPVSGKPITFGVQTSDIKFSPSPLIVSNYAYFALSRSNLSRVATYSSFTLSFWAKFIPFYSSNPTNSEWTHGGSFYIRHGSISIFGRGYRDSVGIFIYSGTTYDVSFNRNAPKNSWHHYAITKSGDRRFFFFDGVKYHDRNGGVRDIDERTIIELNAFLETAYYDDIVLITDQCLWTSNFTPPSNYLLEDSYKVDTNQIKRRNIVASNIPKHIILPEEDSGLKIY